MRAVAWAGMGSIGEGKGALRQSGPAKLAGCAHSKTQSVRTLLLSESL